MVSNNFSTFHHSACSWPSIVCPSLKSHFLFSFSPFSLFFIAFSHHGHWYSKAMELLSFQLSFFLINTSCHYGIGLFRPFISGRVSVVAFVVPLYLISILSLLPESSSKCWRPKISRSLVSNWECARNWHQTKPSTSKILFSHFCLLHFMTVLLLLNWSSLLHVRST